MSFKKYRSKETFLSIILILFLSGCSTINPFVEPEMSRPDMKWEKQHKNKYIPIRSTEGYHEANNVTIDLARLYARALQEAYRAASAGQIKARVGLDAIMIGTAAAALGIAATGGDAKTAGLLGLGAGTVALAGDRFLITTRKRIWLQGALALECVISAANTFQNVDLNLILLNTELDNLNGFTEKLDEKIADLEVYRKSATLKPENASLTQMVLSDAESISLKGKTFSKSITATTTKLNKLGQILLSKTIEIRLKVEAEIAKTEPDRLTYNQALKKLLSKVPSNFIPQDKLDAVLSKEDRTKKDSLTFIAGVDPSIRNKCDHLYALIVDITKTKKSILSLLKKVIEDGGLQYPKDLFRNCDLHENFGIETLTITPGAKFDLTSNKATSVKALVNGGTPPYTIVQEVLPKEIAVSIDKANNIFVLIPKPQAVAGSHFTVPIKDSKNATAYLIIEFKSEQTDQQSKDETGEKVAPPPSEIEFDPDIEKIQKHLKDTYDLGPKKVDGKLGNDTRKAITLFLEASLEDLKISDEFKKLFPNYPSDNTVDFSQLTKQNIKELATALGIL